MKRCLAFGVLVLLLFLSSAAPGRVLAQEELVVLHTNDLHGQSLARLATVLEEQRREHSHLFWVDAGDLFSGSPVSSAFQGEAEEQSVLALGLDAITFGNHDLDYGLPALQRSLEAGVPWLSANVLKDGAALTVPFVIKEVDSVRVLITGVTTPETPKMSFPRNVEGLTFADPVETLQQLLQEQAGNYQICIVLSHLGYGEDLLLAQRVPGINVIIGGHTHTVLAKPVRIGNTLICHAGSNGEYLGRVVVDLKEGYPSRGELIRIEETIPPHPRLVELEQHYESLLAAQLDEVIGYAKLGYVKRGMGVLLTYALQEYTGADAALYNSGGVRAGLPQGEVTRRDVFAVEPFGNQVVLVTLSGAQFAELLEVGAKRSSDFYEGPRLVDTAKTYTVATTDFLASPDSSYPMLAEGEVTNLGVLVRDVLEEYLQAKVLEQRKEGVR